MKFLKSVLQVLSAIAYAPIYVGIMYLAIAYPTVWILSLSFWKMVLAIVVLGCILEGLVALLQTVGMVPFIWIVKHNKVAYYTSLTLCTILPLCNIYFLWGAMLDCGKAGIGVAIVLSILLLHFLFVSTTGIVGLKAEEE